MVICVFSIYFHLVELKIIIYSSMKQLFKNILIGSLFILMNIIFLSRGTSQQVVDAKTEIDASILVDEKWDIEGSPYLITQSIVIHAGATLTIAPGVIVGVNGSIRVEGTLNALGKPDQPIVFTGRSHPQIFPDFFPWNGISVSGPFATVNLEYFKGHLAETFLNIQHTGSGAMKISKGTLSHNKIAMRCGQINTEWEMTGMAIIENEKGIILEPSFSSPIYGIKENFFCENTSYTLINHSPISFEFAKNCWCDSDASSLERAVFDGKDSVGVGQIFLNPLPDNCGENFLDRFSVGGVTVVLDEDLGTGNDKELFKSRVRIFPIPAKNILEIEYLKIEIDRLIVRDLAGRTLLDESTLPNDAIRLPVEDFRPGIYVLTLISPIGILTKKIEINP